MSNDLPANIDSLLTVQKELGLILEQNDGKMPDGLEVKEAVDNGKITTYLEFNHQKFEKQRGEQPRL